MEIKTKFKFNACLAYDTTTSIGFPDVGFLIVKEITIVKSDNSKDYSVYYSDGKITKLEDDLKLCYDD